MELLTHGGEHHEIGDGGWLMMTMTPEPRTDSRSALLRGFRVWRRLRVVKRDDFFSLIFSPRNSIFGVGVGVGESTRGTRGRGARPRGAGVPPPSWLGCGPPGLDLSPVFFIISKNMLCGVSGHSENFCFCT